MDGVTWRVRRVTIGGFRSIVSATLDLGEITVLVGRNGAGKSNLLDAVQFLADATDLGLSAAFEIRKLTGRVPYGGGFSTRHAPGYDGTLHLSCELDGPSGPMEYGFQVRAPTGGTLAVSREWLREGGGFTAQIVGGRMTEGLSANGGQTLPTDRLVLPSLYRQPFDALKGVNIYAPKPELIRTPRETGPDEALERTGANLYASFARLYRTDRAMADRVATLLRQVLPALARLTPVEIAGGYVGLSAGISSDPGVSSPVDAASLSDGTLRALALLVAAYQPGLHVLTGFEEPESMVHPFAAERLLDAIIGSPRRAQIVLTTQSATLLDASAIKPEMLRVVEYAHGMTRVGTIADDQLDQVRRHLVSPGELLLDGTLRMKEAPADAA